MEKNRLRQQLKTQERWYLISKYANVPMRKFVVLVIIVGFLIVAYFLNIYSQKLIDPRKSFARLMLYFLVTVAMIFGLTFLMVFIIGKLYPQEIMK